MKNLTARQVEIYDGVLKRIKTGKSKTIADALVSMKVSASQFYAARNAKQESDPNGYKIDSQTLYKNSKAKALPATKTSKRAYNRRSTVPKMIEIPVAPTSSKVAVIIGTPEQVAETLNQFL